MKIFNPNNSGWNSKINFIDDNNNFVGFDYSQDCCENFGYYISEIEPLDSNREDKNENDKDFDLEGFNFDTQYFQNLKTFDEEDGGGSVVFRLVKDEKQLFLVLFNSHNGYYSHGFECAVGGRIGK